MSVIMKRAGRRGERGRAAAGPAAGPAFVRPQAMVLGGTSSRLSAKTGWPKSGDGRHAGAVEGRWRARPQCLPPLHRDPFDRMLVAQARRDDLTLVTRDPRCKQYDVAILPA